MIESLNVFFRSGACKRITIHYDLNAIKIRLFGEAGEKAYMFYLYSPWRIVHNGALINSSDLYPDEHLYDSQEEHRTAFESFCATTRSLENIRITQVVLSPVSNDLTIYWENGCVLEKICMDVEPNYHIYDIIRNVTHDFGFNSYVSEALKEE